VTTPGADKSATCKRATDGSLPSLDLRPLKEPAPALRPMPLRAHVEASRECAVVPELQKIETMLRAPKTVVFSTASVPVAGARRRGCCPRRPTPCRKT
jgi:hypothetical protein